jgi:predicted amidophosphoribosyltransferase
MFLAPQLPQICILARVLRADGRPWQADAVTGTTDLVCPRCFAQRTRTASTCWRCGEPFGPPEKTGDDLLGTGRAGGDGGGGW